jgi:hypothetical protein
MKNIVDVINEAAVKPQLFVQSWSTNPPLDVDLGYINYDRLDVPLDVDFADELSPKFLKWYENNAEKLNSLTFYHNNKYDYFAVLGNRNKNDEGYPVFADGLTISDFEEWLKKNGKSASTKASKY